MNTTVLGLWLECKNTILKSTIAIPLSKHNLINNEIYNRIEEQHNTSHEIQQIKCVGLLRNKKTIYKIIRTIF